ncbi:phage regulatory protein, Rha family [Aeromonas sp. DSM 116730]|uniref:Rha family transcriptional regulator n=1 Tax=Aeromonas sp. DSM 116730 TaxID=3115851 RepID=UPI0039819613
MNKDRIHPEAAAFPEIDQITAGPHGKATTTSLKIAEVFGKRHDNVLRAIDKLEASNESKALNFEGYSYRGANGKMQRAYQVTKDGLVMLAGRLGGKQAATLVERYIGAFNQMALYIATLPSLKVMMDEHTKQERASVADGSDAGRRLAARKKAKRDLVKQEKVIAGAAQMVFEGMGFDAPKVRALIATSEKGGA